MTISNQTRVVTAIGNGATTVFPFTFPVYESSHLEVRLYTRSTGTYITLNPADYSVTGIGTDSSGGEVTYNPGGTPIPSTQLLAIYRTLPYTQDIDIINQSGFYPDVIEFQLDRIVMQIQQLAEEISRALLIPPTTTVDTDDLTAYVISLGAIVADLQALAAITTDISLVADIDDAVQIVADNIALILDSPLAFERSENVFVDVGMAAANTVTVPGGYVVGEGLQTYRNGSLQKEGASPGTGPTDADYTGANGTTVVFPAGVLAVNDWLHFRMKKPYEIATISAADVDFVPAGTLSGTNVQAVLEELDADVGLKAPLASPTFTGNPTAPTPTLGDNDTSIATTAFVTSAIAAIPAAASAPYPAGHLKGFGLTWGSTSSITFAAGSARDDADTVNIIGAVGYAKTINASWVAGAGGGLRIGLATAGNTWYYCFAICMPDGTGVDFIFDTSATAPTLTNTGGRTIFRRIGAVRTDVSGNILEFLQNGDNFSWVAMTEDLNSATVSVNQTVTLLVPPIAGVRAYLQGLVSNATNTPGVWIRRVGQSTNGNMPTAKVSVAGGAFYGYHTEVVVDASGQITVSANNANTTVIIGTYAYDDHRGRY